MGKDITMQENLCNTTELVKPTQNKNQRQLILVKKVTIRLFNENLPYSKITIEIKDLKKVTYKIV